MGRLARVSFFLLASLIAACGEFIVDDKDFSDNRRNVDITLDNTEELLWSTYQASIAAFRHAELYRGVDGYEFVVSNLIGSFDCPVSGRIEFDYPRMPYERYEVGDKYSIEYIGCVRLDGYELNGRVEGAYTGVSGYNRGFSSQYTIDECISDVGGELDNPIVISSSADSLILERKSNQLFLRYRDIDPESPSQLLVVDDFVVDQQQDAVVVNRSKTDPSSALPSDGVALYSVQSTEEELLDCVYAERDVALVVSNLSIASADFIYAISGNFDLRNRFRRKSNNDFEISGRNISVAVSKLNYAESFVLNDFVWSIELGSSRNGLETDVYAIEASAEFLSADSNDIFEMVTFIPFRGEVNSSRPDVGRWRALGRNDESAAGDILSPTALQFNASLEGDADGDGREDFGTFFSASWAQFLSRDFIRPNIP